jgi:hypothetical protein
MNNVRKEVRDLITINEKIQSALVNGDRLSDDEAALIRQCASELLETIPAPRYRPQAKRVHSLGTSAEEQEKEDSPTASWQGRGESGI